MTKRFGFTLAEVLITLGIIGVVAAMTIPTLIANTNSAKFRSQFKKTISTLNQAGLMAEAQYDVDFAVATAATAADDAALMALTPEDNTGTASLAAIFKGTLVSPTLTYTDPHVSTPVGGAGSGTVTGTGATGGTPIYMGLADGSMVAFYKEAADCSKTIAQTVTAYATAKPLCLGYIDVNGKSLPNREVNCGGSAGAIAEGTCEVGKTAANMTDIYPIAFHDATVEPITPAGRYVLTTSK